MAKKKKIKIDNIKPKNITKSNNAKVNPKVTSKNENVVKEEIKETEKKVEISNEISKLNEEITKWKNDYYKVYADMANLRKTMEKDQINIYKYRIEGFASNLLGVLDSFEFAFKAEVKNEETKNYLIGFQYVYNQLVQVLKDEGIEEINPSIDAKYDLNNMQVVDTIESDGEENIIKKVTLKGYRLHDHLIRPAMVEVTKHKEIKDDVKKDDVKETENK